MLVFPLTIEYKLFLCKNKSKTIITIRRNKYKIKTAINYYTLIKTADCLIDGLLRFTLSVKHINILFSQCFRRACTYHLSIDQLIIIIMKRTVSKWEGILIVFISTGNYKSKFKYMPTRHVGLLQFVSS